MNSRQSPNGNWTSLSETTLRIVRSHEPLSVGDPSRSVNDEPLSHIYGNEEATDSNKTLHTKSVKRCRTDA